MPYTYTLAWQAHGGLPLMRPLVLNYPDDRAGTRQRVPLGRRPAGRAGDAAGRHALAGLSARRHMARFLDRGASDGPARHHGPAPLDRLPLFVRAGAIVPMGRGAA